MHFGQGSARVFCVIDTQCYIRQKKLKKFVHLNTLHRRKTGSYRPNTATIQLKKKGSVHPSATRVVQCKESRSKARCKTVFNLKTSVSCGKTRACCSLWRIPLQLCLTSKRTSYHCIIAVRIFLGYCTSTTCPSEQVSFVSV